MTFVSTGQLTNWQPSCLTEACPQTRDLQFLPDTLCLFCPQTFSILSGNLFQFCPETFFNSVRKPFSNLSGNLFQFCLKPFVLSRYPLSVLSGNPLQFCPETRKPSSVPSRQSLQFVRETLFSSFRIPSSVLSRKPSSVLSRKPSLLLSRKPSSVSSRKSLQFL